MEAYEKIILPLDVDNAEAAVALVGKLRGHVGAFKVGLELVNATGPDIFDRLREAGADKLFYDCKLHDIPNTVAGASRCIAKHGLWMMNVHASGGSRMIAAAVSAMREVWFSSGIKPPTLLAVTLLTSISPEELAGELRVPLAPDEYVAALARMACDAGAQGVVASPREIEVIRRECGPGFLIITPGVRPAGSGDSDQRRTMTPGEAMRLGANYLVIGRPITAAPDPAGAADAIAQEIASAIE